MGEPTFRPVGMARGPQRRWGQQEQRDPSFRPVGKARGTLDGRKVRSTGAVDEWFIGDGQAFVQKTIATQWLKSVDNTLTAFGGQRSGGAECKSVAILI